MQDLIQLTNPEIAMQSQEITLREIADIYIQYKKNIGEPVKSEKYVHSNLIRDFNSMVKTLTPESLTVVKFDYRDFKTKAGNTYKTIVMDLKTSVWFVSKFDHNLRARLVNYAFNQLEKENQELVQKIIDKDEQLHKDMEEIKHLQHLAAERFRTYDDFKPISKWKYELGLTGTSSELLDIMEDYGVIRTEMVQIKKRYNVDTKNVRRIPGGNIVFNKYIVEKVMQECGAIEKAPDTQEEKYFVMIDGDRANPDLVTLAEAERLKQEMVSDNYDFVEIKRVKQ